MQQMQELADGLEFGEELTSFESLREAVEAELAEGRIDAARIALEKGVEQGDASRVGEENKWLYARLGEAYDTLGEGESATEALERALEFEPRDGDIARRLAGRLVQEDRLAEALEVIQLVLLNHKQHWSNEGVAEVYRQLGEIQEGMDAPDDARVAYEKAVVKDGDNREALEGLLRVVAAVGEPADVVEARLKLIRSLEDAEDRSRALVELGRDWETTFNAPVRALDTYEEALTEWSENREAVEAIAEVGARLEDWRRVSRAYFTLSVLSEDPAEKAECLIQSSDVARRELWEPEKALAGYRKALRFDPTRLDAFTAVTSILVDAQDWESLEEAYVDVIAANREQPEPDRQLLGVLWQKLGELYGEHLGRSEDAVFAYEQALEYLPGRDGVRRRLIELAEEDEALLDRAADHLRTFVRQDRSNPEWIERLGKVYLRKKDADRAYCMFRALRAKGHPLEGKAKSFVDRFDSGLVKSIQGAINTPILKEYIFAPGMDMRLNRAFAVLKKGLRKWVGESRRKYGLGRRDRIKLKEQYAFVNFYKRVGSKLGYVDLPRLWQSAEQAGMMNGALSKPGFIVSDELVKSAREKKIAFTVAKQLFLFLEPFYLAAIRPMSDLQAFFLLGVALVQPETGLEDQFQQAKRYKKAYKKMRRRIDSDDQAKLKKAVDALTADGDEVVLGPWIEAIEDSANRLGLLFCDDLEVARECLMEEPQPLGERSVDQRMDELIEFSISEPYLELRPQLGISVAV